MNVFIYFETCVEDVVLNLWYIGKVHGKGLEASLYERVKSLEALFSKIENIAQTSL